LTVKQHRDALRTGWQQSGWQSTRIDGCWLREEASRPAGEVVSPICNLYSITTNQAAIIRLFRVINRYVGNLRR